MTLEDLERLCIEWQERLRLQDWRIYLTIARARDMHLDECSACIRMYHNSKEATIQILDELDYPTTSLRTQDQEISLVHELLHIPFHYSHGDDENKDSRHEEQAIHCISEALVKLKREASIAQ